MRMSTPEIIRKLTKELRTGITTEVQVVYLLAGIRKLMERDKIKEQFEALTFHCDWVLHSQLRGPTAQAILSRFDAASLVLKNSKVPLRDLPSDLRVEIDKISKMESFEEELSVVLSMYDLPQLSEKRPEDGWTHFLNLYAKVIKDIPLEVTDWNASAKNTSKVVVSVREADLETDVLFAICWSVHDKNEQYGEIDVYNTFEK